MYIAAYLLFRIVGAALFKEKKFGTTDATVCWRREE